MVVHLRACSLETPQVRHKVESPSLPLYSRLSIQNRPENSAAASLPAEKPDIPQVQLKTLEELTSEEFVRQVIELYKAPTVGQDGKRIHPKPAMSDPILDKAQRAQIHQVLCLKLPFLGLKLISGRKSERCSTLKSTRQHPTTVFGLPLSPENGPKVGMKRLGPISIVPATASISTLPCLRKTEIPSRSRSYSEK